MASPLQWQTKTFQQLSTQDLYDLLHLRQEVFMLEQTCLYPDIDYKDQRALHLLGYQANQLVAYSRLFALGDYFDDGCSFGRIVSSPKVRGQGLGKQLVAENLKVIKKHWPNTPCKISAQSYLQRFYEGFGFEREGDEYLEDDIPHVAMWLRS